MSIYCLLFVVQHVEIKHVKLRTKQTRFVDKCPDRRLYCNAYVVVALTHNESVFIVFVLPL